MLERNEIKNMKKSIITIVTPLIFLCSYGWSAEFNWSGHKETKYEESVLTIKGEIEKGDSEKLLKQILSHEHIGNYTGYKATSLM